MTLSQNPATPSRQSHWRQVAYAVVATVLLGVAVFAGLFWYASRPQFAARMHQALVSTLEHSTGGRIEMGAFQWNVRHLSIEVDNLTIHGKETPGQVPYFHVDHLSLRAKIITFLEPKIGLASLVAQSPTVHLILYPDGTTNQPQPRLASQQPLTATLLNLAIDHTRIQNGLVLINDRAIPWEMAAGPLQLTMRYVAAKAEYQAALHTKNITFKLKNAMQAHSQLVANIDLTHDAVQIESLDLKTGSSHLAITGRLQNFSHPVWEAKVQGAVSAGEIGAITGINELRNGAAHLSLNAHGAAAPTSDSEDAQDSSADADVASATFQVAGHVDLRYGEWESPWLRIRNVELHTNLIVDDDQCSLYDFSSILDDEGRIDGSLVMKHCVGPSAPVVRPIVRSSLAASHKHPGFSAHDFLAHLHRKHPQQANLTHAVHHGYQPLEADLRAHVSDVTLPLILGAVAPKEVANIGFATAASGEVTGHWTGNGSGLVVSGVLTMRAPRRLMGLIPVGGSARASYLGDHRHLVIERADVATPGTQVHGAGILTLLPKDLQSNLHLDVVGQNLGEFDRLLTVLDLWMTPKGQPHALPLQLLGSATYHGDVHGSFFALETVGHIDSQRFQVVLARAAAAPVQSQPIQSQPVAQHPPPPTHRLTFDQLHADVNYKPWQFIVRNGVLVRGNTVVHATVDLLPPLTAPDIYTYTRQTHIRVGMQASNASIADLQAVLGTAYPASGMLAANAHVVGMVDDLQGAGHIGLTQGVLDGQAVPKASVQLVAQGHVLEVTQLQLATTGGTATGELAYDYKTDALQGQLTGQDFALDKIAALEKQRLPLGGTLVFRMQAAGTTTSPILTGALQIEKLTLNHAPMGRLHAESHLQGGILYLTSRADLLNTHLDGGGQVQLSGNYPAQLELTFADFNVDPLLRLMTPSSISAKSALEGRITLSGPLKQLAAIQADADLKAFTATIGSQVIHSQGPVQLSLRGGMLQMKQMHVLADDMEMIADGTVDLLKDNKLRLHSEGSINAALAGRIDPDIQSSGNVHFVVNARGTVREPDLRGRAEVSHVTAHLLNVTNGITDLNGTMLFDQDRLVVQQLKGQSGGGQLDIRGFVGYRNGVFVDLKATTEDVRIRYPKGVSSTVDAKLRLLGNSDSSLLSGTVQMMRFGIGSNIDLASLAGGGGVSAPIDPTSPLNRVRLDIHVTSAPELGFQNSFASLAGDINLHIRGTLEDPSVLGRVDIAEGSASFAGTTYRLQQGAITFSNPVTISPQIDLEASARVQDYDIIITLHGPPSKLDISYRSEPPLTQADVLALLALGRTNEQAAMYGEQEQQGANLTSEALLGGALNAAVSSRVQKLFGVGSVRVDPNFVGALGESTARVTVEEQVGKDLTLTFATNVNTTAQQLIQAEYDLTRSVSIIAVRDEADVFSMYLQIRGKHK